MVKKLLKNNFVKALILGLTVAMASGFVSGLTASVPLPEVWRTAITVGVIALVVNWLLNQVK